MILSHVEDALAYLGSLHWTALVRMCWFFFLFDFPRYVLTDLYILLCELVGMPRRARLKRRFRAMLESGCPLVSVIVPALNEESTIRLTVHSLLEQDYPNVEVIVVDDGSTDRTPHICHAMARRYDSVSFRYKRFEERAGKSAALNYGLSDARGAFVVFVDSDTTFDRDAITNLIMPFADPRVGAVSGNVMPRNADLNLLTSLQQVEYLFTIYVGRRIRARFGTLPIVSGAFGAFRREIIAQESLGGHEPGPGNDSDLTIRVRKRGFRVAFAPDANCLTHVPEHWPGLVKQRWRWDRNLIRNRMRKHRDVFNPFSANFRLSDLVSFLDTIFFHLVLACVTVVYLVDITVNFREALPLLLLLNYTVYFAAELLEFGAAVLLSGRWTTMAALLYLPLYNPYKMLLKFFRLIGYAQELFFRASRRDTFAPAKVRRRMIEW
jgi:biofilm PGA synthesis N-glycosyltransferase PgaC